MPFVIVGIVLFVMIVIITCILAPSSTGVDDRLPDTETRIAIGNINGIRDADPRYVDIGFLGTHDSNTGALRLGAEPEPCASKVLIKTYPLVKNYAFRFTKTQTAHIYDQLRFGSRFLHIKVTYADNTWYTSHSLLTEPLADHLLEILRFLDESEQDGEILSLLFQPINMETHCFAELHDHIASVKYKDKSIFDYVRYSPVSEFGDTDAIKIHQLRYTDIVGAAGECGVVLFERRDEHYKPSWDLKTTRYPFFFDMDTNALHVWHKHTSERLLDRGIRRVCDEIASTDKYDNLLRMNQTQSASTTRTFADFVAAIFSHSLLKIASVHNEKLIKSDDIQHIIQCMPVFQVDFLTSCYGDFNRIANEQIRLYNERLVENLIKNKE